MYAADQRQDELLHACARPWRTKQYPMRAKHGPACVLYAIELPAIRSGSVKVTFPRSVPVVTGSTVHMIGPTSPSFTSYVKVNGDWLLDADAA